MRVDIARLRADLSRDLDLFACAATCCRHIAARGFPLVSVYMDRSGKLRCYASVGYWQVLDGFPRSAGVIGQVVRSGESVLVSAADAENYLEAAPSIVSEACAPVWLDGRTVGAVNIESTTALPDDVVADVEAVAEALGRRMAELGGIAEPTGWRLVADAATHLQNLRDLGEIARYALDVAMRLSGNRSSLLALGRVADGYHAEHVMGPLGDELRSLPQECLTRMGRWVEGPRSCYTVGEPNGEGFTGQDTLRLAGVESLSVFALTAGDEHLGYLLLADEEDGWRSSEEVEQLELFATLVGAAVANSRYVSRLIEQSRRDPLTGLGHSRAFGERLRSVQASASMEHAVLSIDVDHFKHINDTRGHAAGDQVLRALAQSLSATLRGEDCVFRTGGDEFAAIVAVADEDEAVKVAMRLRDAARYVGVDVSIGIALTSPGEEHDDSVFSRADEALYEVKRSGRGDVRLSVPSLPVRIVRPA